MDFSAWFPYVFTIFDVGAVFFAAVLGGKVAREMHFDAIGFVVLAVMASLGGGMIRDTMLTQVPVALTNPGYLVAAASGALVAYLLRLDGLWARRFLISADAFTLGSWAATGVLKALNAHLGFVPAVLLGCLTAVGGGMIRDVAVGRIPAIFGGNTLYATAALAATVPAYGFWRLHRPSVAMATSTLLAGVIVLSAYHWKWTLPANEDFTLSTLYQHVIGSATSRLPNANLAQMARLWIQESGPIDVTGEGGLNPAAARTLARESDADAVDADQSSGRSYKGIAGLKRLLTNYRARDGHAGKDSASRKEGAPPHRVGMAKSKRRRRYRKLKAPRSHFVVFPSAQWSDAASKKPGATQGSGTAQSTGAHQGSDPVS
ncbi:MAG: TRIC cation channel family protein [Actinomycetaceae bacterium]|nr:TRIC cation channel family protein [Actinomycetaceae bacterium]MDY6082357.1 TRIC cation channel family protein [Actinomycetaceae bacterium]